MELNLSDKRVLVTGSSRGVGLAIARSFLEEGSRVILTSRSKEDLLRLTRGFEAQYGINRVLGIVCDYDGESQIIRLKEEICAEWGGLDIVVANVGSGRSTPVPIADRSHFNQVVALNFGVAVDTARVFLPLLKDTKGAILFISSIAGLESIGAPTDYAAAKSALMAFAKHLSNKVASEGIRVNCVAPGNIYFKDGTWEQKLTDDPKGVEEMLRQQVPMRRFGLPQEVSDAVLFLCSDRAAFITGAVLKVDGGQTHSLW